MGQTINSGTVSVNGTITATSTFPTPSTAQTIVQTVATAPNLTTDYQTYYTPTATKTLYVTHLTLSLASAALLSIADNGTLLFMTNSKDGTGGLYDLAFSTPLKITTTLQMKGNAGVNLSFVSIVGWEE